MTGTGATGAKRFLESDDDETERQELIERQKQERISRQAEKTKGILYKPAGMSDTQYQLFKSFEFTHDSAIEVDEKYSHSTSHLNGALIAKIEKGEFVELAKLIKRSVPSGIAEDENKRIQLYDREGSSYYLPLGNHRETPIAINSYKKWLKAFKLYANIYTKANPWRVKEVFDYIETIEEAAEKYSWNNVYAYDIEFRKLMQTYPKRSWGVIYNRGWVVLLREPAYKHSVTSDSIGSTGPKKAKAGKICYRYNNGKCTFQGCRYEHRCSYCGKEGHGTWACTKKLKDREAQGGGGAPPAEVRPAPAGAEKKVVKKNSSNN